MKIPLVGLAGFALWVLGICPASADHAGFLKLPEERQRAFKTTYLAADVAFKADKIEESLVKLAEAEGIFAEDAQLHNLRGACLTEKKLYGQAAESFRKAARLEPGNPGARFNIAEMHFVQEEWAEAEKAFTALRPELAGGNQDLARLVDLKLVICHSKLGQVDRAAVLTAGQAADVDTPFPYYANAVMEFEKKDAVAAGGLLAEAALRHPGQEKLAPWRDTMVEAGYLKK